MQREPAIVRRQITGLADKSTVQTLIRIKPPPKTVLFLPKHDRKLNRNWDLEHCCTHRRVDNVVLDDNLHVPSWHVHIGKTCIHVLICVTNDVARVRSTVDVSVIDWHHIERALAKWCGSMPQSFRLEREMRSEQAFASIAEDGAFNVLERIWNRWTGVQYLIVRCVIF